VLLLFEIGWRVHDLILGGECEGAKGIMSSESKPKSPKKEKAKRTMSSLDVELLKKELNEANIKHAEEVYWLRLELDTTRRAKEAVEDRMAELYRDVQEMQDSKPSTKRPAIADATYVATLQRQVEKYERMVRVLNNQIGLVRNSSESIVKSLKDEISDLMDEKVQTEMTLMNKLTEVDKEKSDLQKRVQSLERQAEKTPKRALAWGKRNEKLEAEAKKLQEEVTELTLENKKLKLEVANNRNLRSIPNSKSFADNQVTVTEEELQQLIHEKEQLEEDLRRERTKSKENLNQFAKEKAKLSDKAEKLKNEMLLLRSTSEAAERMNLIQQDRDETLDGLERVSTLWNRADEAVHGLESIIMELRPRDDQPNEDRERLLSTLETATLVQGQVKVSLMLVELKLRNSLVCLKNDQVQLGALAPPDSAFSERLMEIQNEAMSSISKIEALVEKQIHSLGQQAASETELVRETMEAKVADMKQMLEKQEQLEEEIRRLKQSVNSTPQSGTERRSSEQALELFVSQQALETLQNEVLQVVEKVKEKNEVIGRLTAEIDEHKVRERTLMEELKRHMKDQADRQLEEQQRIMKENAKYEESDDESYTSDYEYEEKTVLEPEEKKTAEQPSSNSYDEYEEKTVAEQTVYEYEEQTVLEEEEEDETVYEEQTVYDGATVI
jgi:peptidoglycan hydrolase CwlO-like protein